MCHMTSYVKVDTEAGSRRWQRGGRDLPSQLRRFSPPPSCKAHLLRLDLQQDVPLLLLQDPVIPLYHH